MPACDNHLGVQLVSAPLDFNKNNIYIIVPFHSFIQERAMSTLDIATYMGSGGMLWPAMIPEFSYKYVETMMRNKMGCWSTNLACNHAPSTEPPFPNFPYWDQLGTLVNISEIMVYVNKNTFGGTLVEGMRVIYTNGYQESMGNLNSIPPQVYNFDPNDPITAMWFFADKTTQVCVLSV